MDTEDEVLVQLLNGCLQADNTVRASAESSLKIAAESQINFPCRLLSLSKLPVIDISHRKLAIVLLKKYVIDKWSEASNDIKVNIKVQILNFDGFDKCLLPSVAGAIVEIAKYDWPEDWDGLLPHVVSKIQARENGYIEWLGILAELCEVFDDTHQRFATPVVEICADITSDNNSQSQLAVFDVFTKLFGSIEGWPKRNSALTPNLWSTCFNLLLQGFSVVLSGSSLKFHTASAHALLALFKAKPSLIKQNMNALLQPLWVHLPALSKVYTTIIVFDGEIPDECPNVETEATSFAFALFELFTFVYERCLKGTLDTAAFANILRELASFAQLPSGQAESLTTSVACMLSADDELDYTVRTAALDLVVTMHDSDAENVQNCLLSNFASHTSEQALPWQLVEAYLYIIGSLRDCLADSETEFDSTAFINSIPSRTTSLDNVIVSARAIWCATQLAEFSSDETQSTIIRSLVGCFSLGRPLLGRVTAARCIEEWCEQVGSTPELDSVSIELAAGLIGLTVDEDLVDLALGAVASLVETSSQTEYLGQLQEELTSVALKAFLAHPDDISCQESVKTVLKSLVQNDVTAENTLHAAAPLVLSVLQAKDEVVNLSAKAISLDLLFALVMARSPVPESLLGDVYVTALQLGACSDDSGVLQSACECLRAYITRGATQLLAVHAADGTSGLELILRVVARLLDPASPEHGAAFVGGLLSSLLARLGAEIGSSCEELVAAVVRRLPDIETITVRQSFLVMFAHLFYYRLEETINLLIALPSPRPEYSSALHFVLSDWLNRQQFFFGGYQLKISILALTKLLHYNARAADPRLASLTCSVEISTGEGNGAARTRGKSAKTTRRKVDVPLMARLLRALLAELQTQLERHAAKSAVDDEWETDDDDEADEEVQEKWENDQLPGEVVDLGLCCSDLDEEEDDDDCLDLDVKATNLLPFLRDALKPFAGDESALASLSPDKREVLRTLAQE